jgi:hypothetical protein
MFDSCEDNPGYDPMDPRDEPEPEDDPEVRDALNHHGQVSELPADLEAESDLEQARRRAPAFDLDSMEFNVDALTFLIMNNDRKLTFDQARKLAIEELKNPL